MVSGLVRSGETKLQQKKFKTDVQFFAGMLPFVMVVAGLSWSVAAADIDEDGQAIQFNRDIRPILSDKCFACHGPDSNMRKSGLRLDLFESAIGELPSGHRAVVPGDVAASEMMNRITSDDANERMPPADHVKQLTAREIDLLKQWIQRGAVWEKHWAFQPVKRPKVPQLAGDDWSRNAIDRFVLRKLRAEGLTPSPEADRATLIRRVSFDLTGLPPTPREVDAFINDESPEAYTKLVDRLLASPRYGERMAQHWLDLARYADSDGYHDDTTRAMWPYRDYVIKSFNANKPFDVFTREQIAGDQMPGATLEQKMGSAFHRNGPTSSEGGADPEEYRVKYAVDRVNTTASVWLGLTLQCAECHDHKFDPFSQEEYYELFAFFDQVPGNHLFRGLYAPPAIDVPNDEQAKKLAVMDAQIATLEKRIAEWTLTAVAPQEVAATDNAAPANAAEQTPLTEEAAALAEAKAQLDVLRKQRTDFIATLPKLRIMQDAPKRIPTYILLRGDFRKHGEQVNPAAPSVLPALPQADTPRLALAAWLTDRDNPLPSRVTVNRFWQMLFGRGIVKTANDFGSQGDYPSHPALLDWLAWEFMASGWDVRHVVRQIVMSSTYRQDSAISSTLLERDPGNRLLARGPRFRMPAEMVRDNALAISGLLHQQVGGPSVKPYQPPGLWEEMAYGDGGGHKYVQDHGESLYRRSVYTFWKRSILYPEFAVFDAPNREECVVTRPTTNTPLQAFVTLNSVTYVEAARVLAERILKDGGRTMEQRVDFAMKHALSRSPEKAELQLLGDVYRDMLEHYRADEAAAKKLVTAGEYRAAEGLDVADHAAWTSVAQLILNLDETLTRE